MNRSPIDARTARVLLLVALSGWGTGCQSVRERRLLVTSDALKSGKAIAIVSTSANEACRFNAAYLEIVDQRRMSGAAIMQLDTASAKSDFSDRLGFFDAFVLQPGDYWLRLRSYNVSLSYRVPNVASFHLNAGEIRYVGDLHVAGCGALLVGMGDEWASVRAALPRRFPRLDVAAVTVQEMGGDGDVTPPAPLSSTQKSSEEGPEAFRFLPIDPVRFVLGLSSGAAWLKPSSANPQGIGTVGPTFYVDVGLTFCDVASVSASFGALFPSDRGSFDQVVVGDGAPYSAGSSLQITNYSVAVGPRTPLLVLSPDVFSVWAAALFADYGWSRIAGNRFIEQCVDCRKEDFDLPDGTFVRIGANIGRVSVSAPRVGFMFTIAYQRYLARAALAQEVRAGFAFWL